MFGFSYKNLKDKELIIILALILLISFSKVKSEIALLTHN